MSVVFVWSPDDESPFGHSSLVIGDFVGEVTSEDDYVSWWPGQGPGGRGANVLSLLPGWKHKPRVLSLKRDIASEGKNPDQFVFLDGLDVDKMRQEWKNIRLKPNAHYRLARKNCCTIVARVLRAGGADAYSNFAGGIHIWMPRDVLRFAEAIRCGLKGGAVA